MSMDALSGHGTKVDYQPTPGAAFVEIAELRDISSPGMSRNEFDATTQNEDIDSYVTGVLRRQPVTLSVNFIPTNSTHDETTGLRSLIIGKVRTGFRFRYPDATFLIASGEVTAFNDTEPVDGLMTADVTLRFSSTMNVNGTIVG